MAWHNLKHSHKLNLKTKNALKPQLSKGLELGFADFEKYVHAFSGGDSLEMEFIPAQEPSVDWDMVEAQVEALFDEDDRELALSLLRRLDQHGFLSVEDERASETSFQETKLEKIRIRIMREVEPYGLCSRNTSEFQSLLREMGLPTRLAPIETTPPVSRRSVPDFVVQLSEEGLRVFLNDKYEFLVANATGIARMVAEYRADLVSRVAHLLTSKCRDWFLGGKPTFLTLSEVARELGVSKSTLSRLVRDKYFEFDGRSWPLSLFFGRSVKGIPQPEVLMSIYEITREDASLTDAQIAQLLRMRKGWRFSRRTVNKYRNILKKIQVDS